MIVFPGSPLIPSDRDDHMRTPIASNRFDRPRSSQYLKKIDAIETIGAIICKTNLVRYFYILFLYFSIVIVKRYERLAT